LPTIHLEQSVRSLVHSHSENNCLCAPTEQIASSVGTYKLGSTQRELNVFQSDGTISRTQNTSFPVAADVGREGYVFNVFNTSMVSLVAPLTKLSRWIKTLSPLEREPSQMDL
jgi:hypothetical protein